MILLELEACSGAAAVIAVTRLINDRQLSKQKLDVQLVTG
jgi:hypothetical protein